MVSATFLSSKSLTSKMDENEPGNCTKTKMTAKEITRNNLTEVMVSTSSYLKELLLLQLNLIEEQQRKIIQKDKEFLALKQERDQLEARVKRMERRIAIKKSKHSIDGDDTVRLKSPANRSSGLPQTQKREKAPEKPKVIQAAPVTISSRADKEFQFSKQLKTNIEFLDSSDYSLCLNNKEEVAHSSEEIVSVPSYTNISSKKDLKSDVKMEESEELLEDITEDGYLKRHSKPEQEEKRRKRWDLQLLRNQRQQEILTQKYQCRQAASSTTDPPKPQVDNNTSYNTDTLFKDASMAMAIEISEDIPVCAFGYHLPAVREREFSLPWFNIEKKEIQLREAKQRMLKKNSRRKSSATGSVV